MEINALMMHGADNVVTCVKEVPADTDAVYRDGDGQIRAVRAEETIPYCHKIAISDIAQGEDAVKYGELIGQANMFIGS